VSLGIALLSRTMKRGFLNTENADDDATPGQVSISASLGKDKGNKIIIDDVERKKTDGAQNCVYEDKEAVKIPSVKADSDSIPLSDKKHGKDSVGNRENEQNQEKGRFRGAGMDNEDENNKNVDTDSVSAVPVPELPNGLEHSDENGIFQGNNEVHNKINGAEAHENTAAAEEPEGGDDKHANGDVAQGTAKDKEDANSTVAKATPSPPSHKHRYELPQAPSIPVPPIPWLVGNPGAHTVSVTCQTVACSEGGVRYMFFVEEEEENANGERIRHSAVGVPDADCKTISATMMGIRPGRPHKLWSVLCTEMHGELHGQPIGFTSAASHPDPPQAPVVSGKQKNSIKLRSEITQTRTRCRRNSHAPH
jgi:hypothetical protein